MYAKLITLTVGLAVIAAMLLALRQERLDISHTLLARHRTYREVQRQLWADQARAAELTAPDQLLDRLQQARLAVEPAAARPSGSSDSRLVRAADDN